MKFLIRVDNHLVLPKQEGELKKKLNLSTNWMFLLIERYISETFTLLWSKKGKVYD